MDDLQNFISSKARISANLYENRGVSWYLEYESLDLSRTVAKTTVSCSSSFQPNDYSVASGRQNPSQYRLRWLLCDRKQQIQSQWHRALEKIEENRRWRKTSAELSEVFGTWIARWSAKECWETGDLQGIACNKSGEEQRSGSAAPTSYSETKALTTIRGSIVEIREVPEETNGLESFESGDKPPTIQVIDEEAYRSFTGNPIAPELDRKNGHASLGSSVLMNGITTPDRLTTTPSGSATSFLTPMSHRSNRFLDNTPDTPESALRPSQTARRSFEPESPLSKRYDLGGSCSTISKASKSSEYLPLSDDVFSQQEWAPNRDQRRRSRLPRPAESKKSFPSPNKDAGNSIRSEALFSWTRTETDSRNLSSHEDGIETKGPVLDGKVIDIRYSEVTIKHEQEHVSSPFGYPAAEKASQDNSPPSFPLNLPLDKSLRDTINVTKTPKFANALEVYDEVTNDCTRRLFEDDATRCFARTKEGQRCSRPQITGTEDSIKQAIGILETGDHESDFEGCERFIETFVQLSQCKAREWPGHNADLKSILQRFKEVVADSLLSGDQTIIENATITKNTTSSYSQASVEINQSIYKSINTFTGYKRYQPLYLVGEDVGSCLRKLIMKPLTSTERKSGYVYAYRADCIIGLVKIGYTSRTIDSRLKAWHVQCGRKPIPVLGSAEQSPNVARVEKLVHMELKECRHKQTKCVCHKTHKEWFEVSYPNLGAVVERWLAWMKDEPYNTDGSLKSEILDKLNELYRPAVLRLETARGAVNQKPNVRWLEETCEFASTTSKTTLDPTEIFKRER